MHLVVILKIHIYMLSEWAFSCKELNALQITRLHTTTTLLDSVLVLTIQCKLREVSLSAGRYGLMKLTWSFSRTLKKSLKKKNKRYIYIYVYMYLFIRDTWKKYMYISPSQIIFLQRLQDWQYGHYAVWTLTISIGFLNSFFRKLGVTENSKCT